MGIHRKGGRGAMRCLLPTGLSPSISTHITSKYNRPVRLGVLAPFTSGESSLRKAQVTQLVKQVKDSLTEYRGENICRV